MSKQKKAQGQKQKNRRMAETAVGGCLGSAPQELRLPPAFEERMNRLLGEQANDFFAELRKEDSVHALRVNTGLLSSERFSELFPGTLTPISYAKDGFLVETGKLGNTVYHHGGMIYLQDPAAMSTLNALTLSRGWKVLDACAAPGGKSSQAAAAVGEDGLVVANEYVSARSRVLAGNLERMGCSNTIVTNVDTAVLGEWYPSCFDLVVADVPCSGEGMFRKNPEAVGEWSPEAVLMCADRQKMILKNLVGCVRPGGYLLYSTCTYGTQENEEIVGWLLSEYPEFRLVPVSPQLEACTADGVALPGAPKELSLTRRFYPHKCAGEGQYVALLQRDGNVDAESFTMQPAFRENTAVFKKEDREIVESFLRETLEEGELPEMRLVQYRDMIWAVPKEALVPPFGVISAGVAVGQLMKGRLEPHHHFFRAFGKRFSNRLELSAKDPAVARYLHGEELPAQGCREGWGVVLAEGCPLGGVKIVGERAKNHYPKGLRI